MSAGYSALIVKLRGSRRNIAMAVSFATDIRPLFRDSPDIDTMQGFGIDLSSYEDVKARAAEIYSRLVDGSMPCDKPWPPERLGLFRLWMDEGFPP
jgi:hypothetical protein